MVDRSIVDLQQQLKEQIVPWAIAPYLIAGLYLTIFDPENAGIVSWSTMGLLLLSLVGVSVVAAARLRILGAWVLNLGGIAMVLLAWTWFPRSNAYHALIYPVLCASIVSGVGAGILMALLTTAASWFVMLSQPTLVGSSSGLAASTAVLWSSVLLLAAVQHSETTLIEWTWEWYDRARESLEAARDRQVELKLAIEDLDLAHREAVRLNELLAAAREAIESARRAKEEFVAHVSHELRTPLNMIIGFSSEILARPTVYSEALPQQLLNDVAIIKRNSEHLAALVDDVLELAEANANYMHLNREWGSLEDVIAEACDGVGPFFQKKELQLTRAVPAHLPPVYYDRLRIRQVLLNVLSNAARFTDQGGAHIQVRSEESEVTVVVTDTGPGIESTQLQRLFEPFQQGGPAIRGHYGGTGLGLAISKRLIEMHGGRIGITSEMGRGTTVTFSLPLNVEAPDRAIRRAFHPYVEYAARERLSLVPQRRIKPRLVVMEEGHIISTLLGSCLEDMEVTRVATCEQVERVLQSESAVAVVMNRPPDEGEQTGLVSSAGALSLPVISCWAPERRMDLARLGVGDYLTKPVLAADLWRCIQRVAPEARRILLVDDDADARELYGRILRRTNGVQVFTACDGDKALDLMHREAPDLLLLDLVMPGRDGFAVLADKATDPAIRDIPVVVLSARDPEREPLISTSLRLTRQGGLTPPDLVQAIEALVRALPPRFGAPTGAPVPPETCSPSLVSE